MYFLKIDLMKYAHVMAILLGPGVLYAAPTTFKAFADWITGIINLLITVLLGAAVFFYMYGSGSLIWQQKNGKSQNIGQFIGWGLGILFVFVSIWGILRLFASTIATFGG